jgi:RimJ/RimL family protein N-acetyltransferase
MQLKNGVCLMPKRIDLVFQLSDDLTKDASELVPPFNWVAANPNNIVQYFDEQPLKTTFLKFLKKEFYGVLILENSNWVAYGWISRPSTLGPIHLPSEIQRLKVFWIFYCHTKESFRGRGLYKRVLKLLMQQALNESKDAEIYIDTQRDNIAARKAIVSVGFEPKGIINTYKFGIPKLKSWNWGKWNTQVDHPPLLG